MTSSCRRSTATATATRSTPRPCGQLDANISYDITPNIAVTVEGINLTNEPLRTYGRSVTNVWFAQELQRRFLFGARYKF